MDCNETQNRLHGYIDGELDPDRCLEIETHLAACAACARSAENIRTLRKALHSDALYYQAPADLQRRVLASVRKAERADSSPRSALWRQLRFAAVPACLLLIAFIGWRLMRVRSLASPEDFLVQEVVSEHIRSLMPNHLMDVASSDKHTVKPWFNGKLDFVPPVEDFAAQGFPLVGGRLDYLDNQPVAALVYRHRRHIINLFVWPLPQRAEPAALTRRGYSVLRWTQAGNTFWAVSDLNRNDLDQFARLVQHSQ